MPDNKKIHIFDNGSFFTEIDERDGEDRWVCDLIYNGKIVGSLIGDSKEEIKILANRWTNNPKKRND